MEEKVILETFHYRHEAELFRGFLDERGIESSVVSDDCGAMDPALAYVQGVRLLVNAECLEEAKGALAGER